MPTCPECGIGVLVYDREARHYVCERCGATFTSQDLLLEREKIMSKKFEENKKRKMHSEYLEWWLSAKESK